MFYIPIPITLDQTRGKSASRSSADGRSTPWGEKHIRQNPIERKILQGTTGRISYCTPCPEKKESGVF